MRAWCGKLLAWRSGGSRRPRRAALAAREPAAQALAGWGLALLAAGNALAVVALWWRSGGPQDVHDLSTLLTGIARVSGLLGAYLALVQLLLLARLPDARAARRLRPPDASGTAATASACLLLLVAHAVLVTAGYTLGDRISLPAEVGAPDHGLPGRDHRHRRARPARSPCAVTSAAVARRRLRYETWFFVHLYAYLGIALAFSHQLAVGHGLRRASPRARAYWYALYGVTLGVLVVFRLGVPLVRSLRHRLHVTRVIEEAPGVVSIEIGGVRLDRLGARAGHFFTWRFLTRDHWWEAHPVLALRRARRPPAADHGQGARATTRGRLRAIPPGTRVIAEGPFGAFTTAARRRARVVLIAGGVGITPIRALLEDTPGGPGDIAVVYRAVRPGRRHPAPRARRAGRRARRRGALRAGRPPRGGPAVARAPASGSCRTSPSATSTCAGRRP